MLVKELMNEFTLFYMCVHGVVSNHCNMYNSSRNAKFIWFNGKERV